MKLRNLILASSIATGLTGCLGEDGQYHTEDIVRGVAVGMAGVSQNPIEAAVWAGIAEANRPSPQVNVNVNNNLPPQQNYSAPQVEQPVIDRERFQGYKMRLFVTPFKTVSQEDADVPEAMPQITRIRPGDKVLIVAYVNGSLDKKETIDMELRNERNEILWKGNPDTKLRSGVRWFAPVALQIPEGLRGGRLEEWKVSARLSGYRGEKTGEYVLIGDMR